MHSPLYMYKPGWHDVQFKAASHEIHELGHCSQVAYATLAKYPNWHTVAHDCEKVSAK